jgi:hypothetical protein
MLHVHEADYSYLIGDVEAQPALSHIVFSFPFFYLLLQVRSKVAYSLPNVLI